MEIFFIFINFPDPDRWSEQGPSLFLILNCSVDCSIIELGKVKDILDILAMITNMLVNSIIFLQNNHHHYGIANKSKRSNTKVDTNYVPLSVGLKRISVR